MTNMSRTSPAWVGEWLDDEVDGRFSVSEGQAHLQSLVDALPDHNKIRYQNLTSMAITWMHAADPTKYLNAYTDTISVDQYLYCVPLCDWRPYPGSVFLKPIPEDTCRTSASYGKVVDSLRMRDAEDGKLQPVWNFIENVDQGSGYLSPDELKGAAMNSVIHEVRGLIWFNQSFAGSCLSGNAIRVAQTTPSYPCASHIAAMGDVNNTITAIAPVLNTQSYLWTFGPNLDTMLKAKDGYAYILAMTDGGTGSRSFALPSGISGASVEVYGEGRSLAVTGSSFTDKFDTESTYHIYKIKI